MWCSRMHSRVATIAPMTAVAAALGLCCGLTVLLSLGVLGAAAGLSMQSWALIEIGLVLAVLGWARRARRRRRTNPGCDIGGAHATQDPGHDQSLDATQKGKQS